MKRLLCALSFVTASVSAATIPDVTFTVYPIGSPASYTVTALTVDDSGERLWFTDQAFAQIGSIDLDTGEVRKFSVSPPTGETVMTIGSHQGLAFGADGKLYFPAVFNFTSATPVSMIGRFDPASGVLTYLRAPEASAFAAALGHITRGGDGNVYFTDPVNGKIGVVTPAGTLREFDVVTAGGGRPGSLKGIAYGGNGQVWVTSGFRSLFAVPPAGGAATEHRVQGGGFRNPTGITPGPNGFLYFTLAGTDADEGNKIGRINAAGSITLWDVPTDNSAPTGIAVGADGKVYFTEQLPKQIGQLDPATGVVNESPIPNGQQPVGIAAVPASAGNSAFDLSVTELVFNSFPANLRDGVAQRMTVRSDAEVFDGPDLDIEGNVVFRPDPDATAAALGELRAGEEAHLLLTVGNEGDYSTDGSTIEIRYEIPKGVQLTDPSWYVIKGVCGLEIGSNKVELVCSTEVIIPPDEGRHVFAKVRVDQFPDDTLDERVFLESPVTVSGGADRNSSNNTALVRMTCYPPRALYVERVETLELKILELPPVP